MRKLGKRFAEEKATIKANYFCGCLCGGHPDCYCAGISSSIQYFAEYHVWHPVLASTLYARSLHK